MRPRVVLDTNILISASLSEHSGSGEFLRAVFRQCTVLRSDDTWAEFEEVLLRQKFDRFRSLALRLRLLDDFREVIDRISVRTSFTVCVDPKDNCFLNLAVDGGADFLVSGDDHLLRLTSFQEIPILRPADFLNRLRS